MRILRRSPKQLAKINRHYPSGCVRSSEKPFEIKLGHYPAVGVFVLGEAILVGQPAIRLAKVPRIGRLDVMVGDAKRAPRILMAARCVKIVRGRGDYIALHK